MPLCDNEMQHDLFQEKKSVFKKVLYKCQVKIGTLQVFFVILGPHWLDLLTTEEFANERKESYELSVG